MQLASVGDPLVDEDQAGTVFLEELAQHIAGAGRVLVIRGNARECLLAAQLPRQLAPQRSDDRAVGLGHGIPRRDLVADQHHAPDPGEAVGLRLLQHGLYTGQLAGRRAGEQVVEGQHGVGLAAAEIGLQLNDRIAAASGKAAHRTDQHSLQALGQVGTAKELDRVPVLVRTFAQVHLPEVGRELGLLVSAARHVLVGGHDLPPRLQARGGCALDRQAGLSAPFASRLLVEAHPQQLHLDLLELVGLRRRDRGQQPADRIQDAIGIVAGESLLVRPPVAVPAQLTDEAALGGPEDVPKDIVPGFPHQLELSGDVPLGNGLVRQQRIVRKAAQLVGVLPAGLDGPLDLALDERSQGPP